MSKYIDADKAIKDYFHYGIEHSYDATDLEEILNECPAADVAEVKHGRWVELPPFKNIYVCSLCDQWGEHHWNYCPNCGSRMDLDEVTE